MYDQNTPVFGGYCGLWRYLAMIVRPDFVFTVQMTAKCHIFCT